MWKRLDVYFTLLSPLHVGYLPSRGSVIDKTRYYVPGKNFWGAITRRATEYLFNCPPAANEYLKMGKQIKDNFRFMYFYLYDERIEYKPNFTKNGLLFGTEKTINVSEFEHKFIGSRISTAIDKTTRTAQYKSLHEIEFINNLFRNDNGDIRNVKIKGSIFIKEDTSLPSNEGDKKIKVDNHGIFVNEFNLIEELLIGGEQNYGFGLIEIDSIKINDSENVKIIVREDKPIPCHLEYNKNIIFQGEIELLSGRGYFEIESEQQSNRPGEKFSKINYYIAPGSHLFNRYELNLQWNGIGII